MGSKQEFLQCKQCFTLNEKGSFFCSKCGSSLDDAEATLTSGPEKSEASYQKYRFSAGEIFDDRYRIIEEIGRGGMGWVYKAEDTKLNITVALKFIHPRYAAHPAFIDRFKKETLTARSISHENVIRIHDLGESDDIKYLSMEFIKGHSLDEVIRSAGRLSAAKTIEMTRQMCQALDAAHKKGIIHTDFKPSNIMVDNSGHVYVMDFGLARAIYTTESEQDKKRSGTPMYMSPEQAEGKKLDPRTDIYSLGTVIYEMVTGRTVFEGKSSREVMDKHIQETAAAPSKLFPQIPPFLENIIRRCLEKDPAKRFQSTAEILEVLEKHKPLSKTARFTRLLRRPAFAGLLFFLLIAAAILIYLTNRGPSSLVSKGIRKALAVVYLANNTGDPNLDYLKRSLPDLLISDLLQSRYIRVMSTDKIYTVLRDFNLLEAETYSTNELKKIAQACHADYILSGNFSGSSDSLQVNTFLHDIKNMEITGKETAAGTGGNGIFLIVDTLTREIKEDFNLSQDEIYQDIDQDVMEITTSSPEALRHFVTAKIFHNQGKYQESNTELEEAVNLDQEFANAYRMMSINCAYLGKYDEQDKWLAKAQSFLNRVSERDYYLIQGLVAVTVKETIAAYTKLLEIYPDDLETLGLLGSWYRGVEEWEKAREQFEKIIAVDPNQGLAIANIAYCHMALGEYEKARNLLLSKKDIFVEPTFYYIQLAMAYLCQRRFEETRKELENAHEAAPNDRTILELMGNSFQAMDDYPAAEKVYQKMAEGKDFLMRYMGLHWQFYLYLTQKNTTEMLKTIEQGLTFSQKYGFKPGLYNFNMMRTYQLLQENKLEQALESAGRTVERAMECGVSDYTIFSHHLRGLVYVRMGRIEDARHAAQRIEQEVEKNEIPKQMRHYHHLMGEIARSEDRPKEAIEYFEKACSLLDSEHTKADRHILYLDSLASAYLENGMVEKAATKYEKITKLTTGKLRFGDKLGQAFYRLGQIQWDKGNKSKAADHFEALLKTWNAAGSDIPPEIIAAMEKLGR
ncbi:MAG: protein kinase [Candidatus Aminicenantes bacterium]|nr:protein kinase [Candidatus Aminicenantes bacterium]